MIKFAYLFFLINRSSWTDAANRGIKGYSTPKPASLSTKSYSLNKNVSDTPGLRVVAPKVFTISEYDLTSRTTVSMSGLLPASVTENSSKCLINLSVECYNKNNRQQKCANMPLISSTSSQGCFRGVLYVYNVTNLCDNNLCSAKDKVQQLVIVRDGVLALTIDSSQLQTNQFAEPNSPVLITEQVILDFCLQRPIVTRSAVYAVTNGVQPMESCTAESKHMFGTAQWKMLPNPLASLVKKKKRTEPLI